VLAAIFPEAGTIPEAASCRDGPAGTNGPARPGMGREALERAFQGGLDFGAQRG
jgi:hypothetical protein